MTRPRAFPLWIVASLLLAACGGGDSPTGPDDQDPGPGDPGTPTRTIKDDPSFSQDIFEIFTRRGCTASGCHGGGAGGLTMTSASGAFTQLVGVVSNASGEVRVIPGDPANSYLVKKLEGRQSVGARMPLGGAPLDSIDLTNIRNWIGKGAKNN